MNAAAARYGGDLAWACATLHYLKAIPFRNRRKEEKGALAAGCLSCRWRWYVVA